MSQLVARVVSRACAKQDQLEAVARVPRPLFQARSRGGLLARAWRIESRARIRRVEFDLAVELVGKLGGMERRGAGSGEKEDNTYVRLAPSLLRSSTTACRGKSGKFFRFCPFAFFFRKDHVKNLSSFSMVGSGGKVRQELKCMRRESFRNF